MVLGEGTVTIVETGAVIPINKDIDVDWALLRAPLGNTFIIRVGSVRLTKDRGYALIPGKAIKITKIHLTKVCLIGHVGDKIDYTYSEKGIDNELTSRVLLEQLLKELKIMNTQLSIITDEELEVQ